jgi:hypothetical protein
VTGSGNSKSPENTSLPSRRNSTVASLPLPPANTALQVSDSVAGSALRLSGGGW